MTQQPRDYPPSDNWGQAYTDQSGQFAGQWSQDAYRGPFSSGEGFQQNGNGAYPFGNMPDPYNGAGFDEIPPRPGQVPYSGEYNGQVSLQGQQPFRSQEPQAQSRQFQQEQFYWQPSQSSQFQQQPPQPPWQQQIPPQQPLRPSQAAPRFAPQYAGAVRPVSATSALESVDAQTEKSTRPGGVWNVLFFVALLVLVAALSAVGYIVYTYIHGEDEYKSLEQYMTVDDSKGVTTLGSFNVDWDALRAINEDIVGWIYIPDTVINYPIVWRENDDDYYLTHNFANSSVGQFGAEYGCLMLSGVNSPKWTDEVNIIYGHNMRNGTMFAELSHNMDSSVFNSHRTVYVLTPEGNFKLTTFSCEKIIGSTTEIVIPNFNTEEGFKDYVQTRLDNSAVTQDPPRLSAAQIEQVFALSTCSEPDHEYRIITFCSVDEFLPAGSDKVLGNSLVSDSDVANVGEGVGERLE